MELFSKLSKDLSMPDILDNIDAGIIIYDEKGNFVFVNTLMINWRNIPRNEYLQMNVKDFYDVLDVCVFDLVCQYKTRITRLQNYRDYQTINSDIKVRIVTGTPIFDDVGNIKYVVMLLQDVKNFEDNYHALLKTHKILNNATEGGRKPSMSLIAKSPITLQLLAVTNNIAKLDSTILLYGESGCGKEVFANYIHEHSNRKEQTMITVNCAAFPDNLIEAELFGYEKGSFTGASKEGKTGLAEAANKGTLFLDEINSLPLSVQGKVLRMIEEKSIRKIGAVHSKKVDFRIIAATNQDLKQLVDQGRFREDLYYRLNVVPLTIPPLRNRREDIIPLCLHFLYDFCLKYNLQKTFAENVLKELYDYSWPGNVREIRNFVERMVVMTPSNTKEILSIPKGILDNSYVDDSLTTQVKLNATAPSTGKLTKEHLLAALVVCDNNREKTAAYLGISKRQLQYKIKLFHISSRCTYTE